MKITGHVFDELQQACAMVDTPELRERYRNKQFINADKTIDLNRRYRWDVFYVAKAYYTFPPGNNYQDSHIYTALKRIIPDL